MIKMLQNVLIVIKHAVLLFTHTRFVLTWQNIPTSINN
jgi:hypothetical protein